MIDEVVLSENTNYLNGCEKAYTFKGFAPVVYFEMKNGKRISNGVNGIANKARESF